jgi:hypothetical protein
MSHHFSSGSGYTTSITDSEPLCSALWVVTMGTVTSGGARCEGRVGLVVMGVDRLRAALT